LVLGLLALACAPAAAPAPTAAPAKPEAKATDKPAEKAADKPAEKPAAKADGQPVRIGVPLPATGNFAAVGKHMQAGIDVAVKQIGAKVAGRPIELVNIDTEGAPDPGLRVTRRLVERENVDMIVGYVNSAVGYAVRDFLDQSKKPTITMAASAGLTRENKSPYQWRMIPSTFQWAYEPAKYMKDKLGLKRIIFWGADYAAPREGYRAAKAAYGDGIVKEVWTPLNTADYAPYLSGLKAGEADAVVVAAWGADGPRIADQYTRTGLREKMPLFGFANYTGEDALPGFAPQAAKDVQASYVYCSALDNPANKEFVALFKERFGDLPGAYSYASYLGMLMAAKAIELTNGDTDAGKLIQALGRARLENTPTGVQSFDANQGWVTDFFWLKVDLEGGKPVNTCVDRISQVADPVKEFPTAAAQ
jgi:branched-chain amino acid transport system substrate-binding protein